MCFGCHVPHPACPSPPAPPPPHTGLRGGRRSRVRGGGRSGRPAAPPQGLQLQEVGLPQEVLRVLSGGRGRGRGQGGRPGGHAFGGRGGRRGAVVLASAHPSCQYACREQPLTSCIDLSQRGPCTRHRHLGLWHGSRPAALLTPIPRPPPPAALQGNIYCSDLCKCVDCKNYEVRRPDRPAGCGKAGRDPAREGGRG